MARKYAGRPGNTKQRWGQERGRKKQGQDPYHRQHAGGEAAMKADVEIPLAPHAGAVGKEKARAAPGEDPSPRGGRSRLYGEPGA